MNFFSRLSVRGFLLKWTWSGRSADTEQTGRLPGDSPDNLLATWRRIELQKKMLLVFFAFFDGVGEGLILCGLGIVKEFGISATFQDFFTERFGIKAD